MPTYVFVCKKCKNEEDILLTMSKRNEPQKCKKCGEIMIRCIGGGSGFIFKGDGFYCNDYPKEGN